MTTLFDHINIKEAPFFAKGDGTTDDTAVINAAIAAVGTTGGIHFPAGTYKIASNITFGQNTTVSFIPGAVLKPSSSSVLITMTSVDATLQQKIFDQSSGGRVTVLYNGISTPSGKLSVKWWGAVGDGVADDTVAIQAALDAAKDSLIGVSAPTFGGFDHGVEVYIPSGNYLISQQLEVYDWICVKGDFNTTLIAANNNIAIMCISGYFNKIDGLAFQKGKNHIKVYGPAIHYGGALGSPEK
jgi:polygalacturonase